MQAGRRERFRDAATRQIGTSDSRFASLFDVSRETSRAATHVDACDDVLSDAGSTPAASKPNILFVINHLVREAVDRTGLVGIFDIDLRWMPDEQQLGPSPETAPPVDPDAPSIFTAVQEQLGLKLESTKGPVDVLVVDHIERPTPN
jgi:uncharacterized protein (TIGR03435 family)